jgi:diadenosine tetraphosphate (Ap4A) HIT family hydrolase
MRRMETHCDLCRTDGGRLVWRDAHWRVVGVDDADFPAFYRVVCNAHVREFTDLPDVERVRCMTLVAQVERALRERLKPAKINLASLGNMTPHVHWHVIARFDADSRFPAPVWAPAQRPADAALLARLKAELPELDAALRRDLGA